MQAGSIQAGFADSPGIRLFYYRGEVELRVRSHNSNPGDILLPQKLQRPPNSLKRLSIRRLIATSFRQTNHNNILTIATGKHDILKLVQPGRLECDRVLIGYLLLFIVLGGYKIVRTAFYPVL
ncbi:hypothetical protein [Coleofasciculus sp.]|uniref:hypothetical protein n=1 Tax=Coleofasciculus sp. TaxID=3100458 RepID=UPI003A179C4B